jgi:glycosyltransferase involved in cell wall biosynthesis
VVVAATRPELLLDALAAFARQSTDEPFEVIVVRDGGPPLALPDLPYPARSLGLPEARGAAQARNVGVAESQAPLLAFCDDDDLWHPDHLARTVPVARATGGLVYTDAIFRHVEEGWERPLRLPYRKGLLRRLNPILLSSVVLPRRAFLAVGGFAQDLQRFETWDLFLRLEAAGVPITHVPEATITYRYAGCSVSADRDTMTRAFRAFCDRHGLGDIPWVRFLDLALGDAPLDPSAL